MNAALFSTNDESDEFGGNPLGKNYSWNDFAKVAKDKIIEDCHKFLKLYGHLFTKENCPNNPPIPLAGHDFWLTRCGHGSGFDDGDWEEPAATILTDAAHEFGNVDLYLGDDGKIYI